MIICTVCKTENDLFSAVCVKCGSFLQDRVPNLDLFHMLWKVIESPRNAFRLIIRAEHKNYTLLLYVLYGINITFTGFWQFKLGDKFGNILSLFFWALLIGIPLGIALCPLVSFFHWTLSRMFGVKATFRNSLGITSYALTPIMISLIFVLPVALSTFGMYLFTFNPHPIAIKPTSYMVLLGLNITLIAWAFILSIVGTMIGNQVSLWKSILLVSILYVIVLSGLIVGGEYVLRFL
jgi:hypothetical protein